MSGKKNFTVRLDLVKAKHEHDAGECDSWCGWCYQEFVLYTPRFQHELKRGRRVVVISNRRRYGEFE